MKHRYSVKITGTYFFLCAAFFIHIAALSLFSHEKQVTDGAGISDFTESHRGNLNLSLKLIPANPENQIEYDVPSVLDSKILMRNEEKKPKTGKITHLIAGLRRNGIHIRSEFTMRIIQTEKSKEILNIKFLSDDGHFSFGQQFYDGGPYRIEILARSLQDGTELSAFLNTEATAIEPPHDAVFKSLLLLLGFAAAGIIPGYMMAGSASKKRAA